MGMSADATLLYGIVFDENVLFVEDEEGDPVKNVFTKEVVDTFGEIEYFYCTQVEKILEERFGLKLFAYDDDLEPHYALYAGDRTDAEGGAEDVKGFDTGNGKFKEVLEALGLEAVKPGWKLFASYG